MSSSRPGATWSNRAVSFAARNGGEIPAPGALTDVDHALLENSRAAFATVGDHLSRSRFKFAITEAMRTISEANKYFSEQAPWKLRESDPERMKTILHVTLQAVADAKTLLTPFLPRSSQAVHEMLGGVGEWSAAPAWRQWTRRAARPTRSSPATMTRPSAGNPVQSTAGAPLAVSVPLFTKLDTSVVDEEIARLTGLPGQD